MSDDCKSTITRAELEREIRHLREKLDLANIEREKALKLQGLEYNRIIADFQKWKEELVVDFATIKAGSVSNMRFFTIVTVLVSLAFSALSFWLRNK